jgi:hypothetical protein
VGGSHLVRHLLHLLAHLLERGLGVFLLVDVEMVDLVLIEPHDVGARAHGIAGEEADDLRLHLHVAVGARLVAGNGGFGGA